MKTSSIFFTIATILSFVSFSAAAQNSSAVHIGNVQVSSDKQWIGFQEVTTTNVVLNLHVKSDEVIQNVEVECSFDLVNFQFIGNASAVNPMDIKSREFYFEHNAPTLSQQPIAQYRIKYADAYGIIHYSEAKLVGLKS